MAEVAHEKRVAAYLMSFAQELLVERNLTRAAEMAPDTVVGKSSMY